MHVANNNILNRCNSKHPLPNPNNLLERRNKMETNINGIYACGDCIKKDVYQLTTAASDGTIAATSIINRC